MIKIIPLYCHIFLDWFYKIYILFYNFNKIKTKKIIIIIIIIIMIMIIIIIIIIIIVIIINYVQNANIHDYIKNIQFARPQ